MQDIGQWLNSLGLSRYEDAFRANHIDRVVLPGLTTEDLRDLGVTSIGHRRILLDAIEGLSEPQQTALEVSPFDAAKGAAERRMLTVMFVDLVASTALSARLDPEDMGRIVRAYQNAIAGEIAQVEGHVAKFMGDGVLCYFGWPRAHENEAERAAKAGLAIVAAVARLEGGGAPLSCRVGIATGLVVVGDLVGEGSAREEAVVGDTPNLAARLQEVAEPGQVLIADTSRQLLGDLFILTERPAQKLKGLTEPVTTFEVMSERALVSRFAARHGGAMGPIVGRDQELAQLVERWRQVVEGEGQAILVTGEAGIGKSRISEALVAAVETGSHVLLRYQCSPYHGDSALYPAIQQITQAAGFAVDDSTERCLDRFEELIIQGVGDGGAEAMALIADLIGLDGSTRYGVSTLTPEQRRSRTLAALVDQLSLLARERPVMWLVEDAHWIDPTTLELIELALDELSGHRVLLVVTARPTFKAALASHPSVTRLTLNRLSRAATQAIVTGITGGRRLPEGLLDEITARTDGVPLFVEEMTKAVLESGSLRETADSYEIDGQLSALAVPATLHDSLMARLDRLHGVKEVAQTAAVIGRSFDHQTLAALSPLSASELTDALNRLVAAELVFRRGAGAEATYLFKHALVRDAAYESLLKAQRIILHGKLYDALQASGGAAPEIRAQHAEAAGRLEVALDAWEEAGRTAVARPAFREAIADFRAAIRLCGALGSDPRWIRREQMMQVELGQALIASAGYSGEATLSAFERALELTDTMGDPQRTLPAIYGLWAGRYIAATGSADLADRFAATAKTQEEIGPKLIGLRMLALERFHAARFRESFDLSGQSIELYDPETHSDLKFRFGHDPRVAAGHYRGWCLWHLGLPDQAADQMDLSRSWAREVDHVNTTGLGLTFGVSITNLWLRRPDQVELAARKAIQMAEEMSLALWHAWGRVYLGASLYLQGDASGLGELEAGLDETHRNGAMRFDPLHLSIAAEAYAGLGRHDDAKKAMAKAFDGLKRSGDLALSADLHRVRAAITLAADAKAVDVAEADLIRALEIARDQEAISLELRAARDLARLLTDQGARTQAFDLLNPVLSSFTEGFETLDLIEAAALIDSIN